MRKTAAVSVAKLHDINASLVEEQVQFQYMWICFQLIFVFRDFWTALGSCWATPIPWWICLETMD